MENTKKGKCVLFTLVFPYSWEETYLEAEINYLAQGFESVLIIASGKKGSDKKRYVPENVSVVCVEDMVSTAPLSFKDYLFLFKIFQKTFFAKWKNTVAYAVNFRQFKGVLEAQLRKARAVMELLKKEDQTNTVFYDYWLVNSCLALSMIKEQGKGINFISRAHRFDLYEDSTFSVIPFKEYILKYITQVYACSIDGREHMKERTKYKEKISYSYLGTKDLGPGPVPTPEGKYTVISSSRFSARKRVEEIVAVLASLNLSIHWIHFGDGELMGEIEEKAKTLPANITYDLKGLVNIDVIMDFYKTNPVDCFIHLSVSEGLPVSLMEVTSFGIPVVARDVCGVREIVNQETGILLDSTSSIERTAAALQDVLLHKAKNAAFREGVRNFWQRNFNAAINYPTFTKQIKQVCRTTSGV